jgi:hypothetical protein
MENAMITAMRMAVVNHRLAFGYRRKTTIGRRLAVMHARIETKATDLAERLLIALLKCRWRRL